MRGLTIVRLDTAGAVAYRAGLEALLTDAVAQGASVGFLKPLNPAEARQFWQGVERGISAGTRILLAAFAGTDLVGTIQIDLSAPANQRHRAEIATLLVHGTAQRHGVGRRLVAAAEEEVRHAGRTLLTLDARHGDAAEQLCLNAGYTVAGIIPGYARSTDGPLTDTAILYGVRVGVGACVGVRGGMASWRPGAKPITTASFPIALSVPVPSTA